MTETNEAGEADQVTRRKMAMLLSLAVSSAEIGMQWRARQVERAARESQQRQQALAEQVRAERETQRVTWHRVLHGDQQLWRDPQQLAEAYGSVTAWETLDRDAARASARMQTTLRQAGIEPETVRSARESDDYAMLAVLLQQRQAETASENTTSVSAEPSRTHEESVAEQTSPDRYESALREVFTSEQVDGMRGSGAWNDLVQQLDRASTAGHDPATVLRETAEARSLGDVDDIASVMAWRLQRQEHLDVPPPEPPAAEVQTAQQTAHETAVQDVGAATAAQQDLVEDPQLRRAGELVTDRQFGSTSMLQRTMGVTLGQSQTLMDRLHEAGIVGPAEGSLAREVYASRAQLEVMVDAAERSRDAGEAAGDFRAAAEGEHAQAQDAAVRGTDYREGTDVWREGADEAHVAEQEDPSVAEQEQHHAAEQDAERRAETLDGETRRSEGTEDEHDRRAQRYQTGAYDAGAEQARLAGEAYPESVEEGLQRAQNGKPSSGQQSLRHRPRWRSSPELGR